MLKVLRCFVVVDPKLNRARRYVDGKPTHQANILRWGEGLDRDIERFRLFGGAAPMKDARA